MTDEAAVDTRILTTRDVAQLIQVTESYVIKGIGRGQIPASRIGSEWRYWKPLVIARVLPHSEATTPSDDSITEPEVVTAGELATLLRLTPNTISLRIAEGSIPAAKVGKGYRIHWPTVRAVLEQGKDFTPR